MLHDVIVIGGSYAGMAASLQLLRARRSVLIIDAGKGATVWPVIPTGFLGRTAATPQELLATPPAAYGLSDTDMG